MSLVKVIANDVPTLFFLKCVCDNQPRIKVSSFHHDDTNKVLLKAVVLTPANHHTQKLSPASFRCLLFSSTGTGFQSHLNPLCFQTNGTLKPELQHGIRLPGSMREVASLPICKSRLRFPSTFQMNVSFEPCRSLLRVYR